MNTRTLLNIMLFACVLFLGALVVWTKHNQTAQTDSRLPLLSAIDLETVSDIRIHHNQKAVQLSKQPIPSSNGDDNKQTALWMINSPFQLEANGFRLQSVLALLHAPVHASYPAADHDLSTFGLLKPTLSIRFDKHRIDFGNINPITGQRYILYNQTVYTIEDIYSPLLTANPLALASLNLLPQRAKPVHFQLLSQQIDKDVKGFWHSNTGLSADRINELVHDWQTTQAFGVHQYLKKPSLGECKITLTEPASTIRFQITDTDPWLVLARPELGIEYHLDIEAYDKLINPQQGSLSETWKPETGQTEAEDLPPVTGP